MPVFLQAGGVYWTDRGASQLKRMNFDGSNLQTILLSGSVTSPGRNLRGLAVDNVSNRIFWADNGADRLLRANLDGSGSVILHTITGGNSFPADVRMDFANQQLYWCDQTRLRIQRSTFDGTAVTDVITNAAASGPYFMDLDVPEGKIYWGDFSGGSIFRANLDGSQRETLLTGNNTRGVRIDPRERMLYWINRDDKKVHRCPLAAFEGGTIPLTHPAVQTLYTNLDTPHGLTLDIPARKIYWADTGTNPGNGTGGQSICRGDFDGSTPLEILATGSEPWDVDLDLRCASYTEWVQRCFRRDASVDQIAPEADPDGDGVPNAVEYAFDLSPMHADQLKLATLFVRVTPGVSDDQQAVIYLRRSGVSDLKYNVQVSTNLLQWSDGETVEASVAPGPDGTELVLSSSIHTLMTRSNHFMRVQVQLAPQ
ncbi:MAG: hypothetical protein IPK15_24755 [Verrucomicrobia bacterium]|nr:hypothetical protein [Verrucomicrobiota bacterium]